MPTKLDGYWDIVANAVKERVKADSNAEILDVLGTLFKNGTIKFASTATDNYTLDDLQIILGKILETNEYKVYTDGNYIHIKKNPTYELDQNVKATNNSVQKLNKTLFWTNIISTVIAAITGFFIAMTFFKNDSKDLQILNNKLDRQEQILDSMLHREIGKNSALQKALRDTALTLR